MRLDSVNLKEFIDNYIKVRIQADGGEIKFLSFQNNILTIQAQGECSKCNLTETCLKEWIVEEINKEFNKMISINIVRKKPYFWDK